MKRTIFSARQQAFWELTKPRISLMVLVTIVVAGFVGASGAPDGWLLWHVAFGMFMVAASGNAMNMYLERYTDFLMPRTAKRPLPDQRLSARDVAMFAAICFGVGIGYLATTLNWQTTVCAAATWLLYVFVYTPMKTRTWLNTEVGALAGALPVVAGSLATSGGMNWYSLALFLVLVLWQFPHFMAIAWMYRDQYREGGLQMLTVVEPTGVSAGRKAVALAVGTWLVSLMPVLGLGVGTAAMWFAGLATVAGLYYLIASIRFARERDDRTAWQLLRVSVIYLPIYLILLVAICLH
ncbi:MAG TPA: heme o synthase [Pirellulaceae bacterium]|nr:heme o synthase [Pirellulaceae bacterium]